MKFVSSRSWDLGSCTILSGLTSLADYDPNNPQPSHCSQVVWKATTQVGCAMQPCDGIFDPTFGVSSQKPLHVLQQISHRLCRKQIITSASTSPKATSLESLSQSAFAMMSSSYYADLDMFRFESIENLVGCFTFLDVLIRTWRFLVLLHILYI